MNNLLTGPELTSKLIDQISELYCQIWREPPWNEDFWKPIEVRATIEQVLDQPSSVMNVKLCGSDVAGFTWGYRTSRNPVLDHLKLSGQSIFYLAELGVNKNYRRQGIGQELSRYLIKQAQAQGESKIVLRTDLQAQSARRLYQSLGFQELSFFDPQHANRTYWLLRL
ncbi:GNAT family N-acetyltransferase [Patescibacteria group bacterium]